MNIKPLHEVRDQTKAETIAADMSARGWVGHPVLALDCGDYLQAITGTHRLAAAEIAGIAVNVCTIEPPAYCGDDEQADLFCSLTEGDDDQRLAALTELVVRGDVEQEALDIMLAEQANTNHGG